MAASGDLWRLSARPRSSICCGGARSRRWSWSTRAPRASRRRTGTSTRSRPSAWNRARAHAARIMAEDADTERPPGWLGGVPTLRQGPGGGGGCAHHLGLADLRRPRAARARTSWSRPWRRAAPSSSASPTRPSSGAGANTFNEVFGKTRNPWNTDKTCGGSSGGSSTALATGQVWLATGSDLGGSLRIPASFCSIFGFRPEPPAASPTAPSTSPSRG